MSEDVTIADIQFRAYLPFGIQVPSRCSISQSLSKLGKKQRNELLKRLNQTRFPSSSSLIAATTIEEFSPAAQAAVFLQSFPRQSRPLTISIHFPDDNNENNIHPRLLIKLPASHIPGTPECPGRPQQISAGNPVLQSILWHSIRLQQLKSNPTLPSSTISPCGIVGCDGACCPKSIWNERLAFHLDRIYQAQTTSMRNQRRSSILSLPSSSTSTITTRANTSTSTSSSNSLSPYKAVSFNLIYPKLSKSPLFKLPDELLLRIVSYLSPADLASFSACNPLIEQTLLHIIPGLKLRLFPHQLHALRRMSAMESLRVRDLTMPLLHSVSVPGYTTGPCLTIDLVDGSILWLDGLPCVGPPSGGLFCDEPGLGKTVTAIALILKTLGCVARPPDNFQIRTELPENDMDLLNDESTQPVPYYIEQPLARFQAHGQEQLRVLDRKSRLLPDVHGRRSRGCSRSVQHTDFLGLGRSDGVPGAGASSTRIYLSHATLVVVPTVLTEHWSYQLNTHVEQGRLCILHINNSTDVPSHYQNVRRLARDYDIIIVSFDAIRQMHDEMRCTAPVLMRIHFRRIIIDEGHSLSSSSNSTSHAIHLSNLTSVCHRLRAQSRWVMTGTPTPSTPRSDVDHLYALLRFLREDAYGLDRKAWDVGIRAPYSEFKTESLERLSLLLSRIMIRADKTILSVKCHIRNVILDFSDASAKSYNGVVRMVRRNLLTSDWYSETHEESLLNPKNYSLAAEVFKNLKLACCAGGSIAVEFSHVDVVETLDILYDQYRDIAKLSPHDRFADPTFNLPILDMANDSNDKQLQLKKAQVRKSQALHEALLRRGEGFTRLSRQNKTPKSSKGGETYNLNGRSIYSGRLHEIAEELFAGSPICQVCHQETPIPMITPCAHFICDTCIVKDCTKCIVDGCGIAYELDKNGIPENLIELQPSASSNHWVKDWANTNSAKVDYLLDRIVNLPEIEEWEDGKSNTTKHKPKVIVHSEYNEHLKYVMVKLRQHETLRDSYVEMTKNELEYHNELNRLRASDIAVRGVDRFKNDENCHILLMNTRHGAVGLDLSFVQYIFLLEPVWDRAVEFQIISRAHRIGCNHDIFVERLVMKGSVEHGMLRSSEDDVGVGDNFDNQNDRNNTPVLRASQLNVSGVGHDRAAQDRKRTAGLLRDLKLVKGISEIERERRVEKEQNSRSRISTSTPIQTKRPRTSLSSFASTSTAISISQSPNASSTCSLLRSSPSPHRLTDENTKVVQQEHDEERDIMLTSEQVASVCSTEHNRPRSLSQSICPVKRNRDDEIDIEEKDEEEQNEGYTQLEKNDSSTLPPESNNDNNTDNNKAKRKRVCFQFET